MTAAPPLREGAESVRKCLNKVNGMSARAGILVRGATGQVGGALLPLLAESVDLEVIAAVRTPAQPAQGGTTNA